MAADARVYAAMIAAGASLIMALLSWWKAKSVQRSSAMLENESLGYRHMLERRAEELKADLKRGLTSLEVTERMRAELRLRLFQGDEARVAETTAAYRECYGLAVESLQLLAHSTTSKDGRAKAQLLRSQVLARGVLLPEELHPAAISVEESVIAFGTLDLDRATVQDLDRSHLAIVEAMNALARASHDWRERKKRELLDSEG